jgi:type VI secretion system protein ImpA
MDEFINLVSALSDDAPCGISVEYDPDFLALEEQALGKPEVEYGSTLTPATPPNWVMVKSLALSLAQRTRDLRIALHLTRAELNLSGIHGLAAGLVLIEALLVEHWDQVHPQLDADEDHDPQLRVNVLAALCDDQGLLQELRLAPLIKGSALGDFNLRDIDLASGELASVPGVEAPSLAVIEGAFQQVGPGVLAATLAALIDALARSRHIEQLLTEKVGLAHAIDLSALSAMLNRAVEVVRRQLPAEVEQSSAPSQAHVTGPGTIAGAQPRAEIASREDVRLMLDKLCSYFATHEPASPVPLLLQRARNLVNKSFIELLQDLAPDGLPQLAQVTGQRDND